jgi:hypothetical protein
VGISRDPNFGLNPLLQTGSPALAKFRVPPTNGFYQATAYRGAFNAQNNWMRTWTLLDQAGFIPANTAPVPIPITTQIVDELVPFSITVKATDDGPLNQLAFTRVAGPTGLAVAANGVVTWTPDETFGGTTNVVSVRVTDSAKVGLSATNTFSIIVREVNRAPIFGALFNQTVAPGALLSISLPATDPDVPVQTLTRALVSGPAGMTVTRAGTLNWTPSLFQAGTTNLVSVKVTDNGVPALSVSNSFTVVVSPLPAKPIVNIPAGNLTGTNIWRSTNVYMLQGFVHVLSGAVLQIEPGTVIKGAVGTGPTDFGCLFICRGGKILADGTAAKPIIFTSELDDETDPSDLGINDTQWWGGVILLGNAKVNNAVNAAGDAASPKFDVYEGLADTSFVSGGVTNFLHRFGGGNDNDSSGILRYVSLRHGGKVLESNKEVNGLSICGVGRGTTLEYIEVFANSDDGFEFFGGSVNTRYLVSAFNQDEQFDADQGYNGLNQFWFGIQGTNTIEKGMEINGEPQDRITGLGTNNVSNWEVYNATLIGGGARVGAGSGNNAFTFRAYTRVGMYNGIFTDFNGQPVTGGTNSTGANPTVLNNILFGFTVPTNVPAAMFDVSTTNEVVNPLLVGISRIPNFGLNPLLQVASPALAPVRIATGIAAASGQPP